MFKADMRGCQVAEHKATCAKYHVKQLRKCLSYFAVKRYLETFFFILSLFSILILLLCHFNFSSCYHL